MPLFNYQCNKCEVVIEKFQHKIKEEVEITCSCGNKEFTKLFGKTHNRVWLNSKELMDKKISPDIERIRKDINKGKDKDFLDIYGDK